MATRKTTASKPVAVKPAYPKNLGVTGILSFPIWNEDNLSQIKEWRSAKGYSKPKFPDVKGGTLFLTQPMVDKVQAYLLEELLPYAAALNEFDDGKGLDPDNIELFKARIENEEWGVKDDSINLPIQMLSAKDQESVDDDSIVAKFKYRASGDNDISAKLLVRDEDNTLGIRELGDIDGIPVDDSLFWGARNTFRGAFNLNPYQAAKAGISAYTRVLYLRTDLPMVWGGGDDTETILEEDFE